MALELIVSYDASATVYAVIRRQSDQYVWNTASSAFAVWADGSITDYDVALATQGGDVYAANFPSGIGSGEYVISYYAQTGASPAITDPLIGSESGYWNGTAISDSPATDNYVSLARVKRYLNIPSATTTYDDQLLDFIPTACRMIDSYVDVDSGGLASASRTEYHNGLGRGYLTLRSFPITTGPKVRYATAAMEVTNSDTTNNQEAYVAVTASGLDLIRYNTSGTLSAVTINWSAAKTLTALAGYINAQSSLGWSATVTADYANWNPSRIRESQGQRDAYASNVVELEVFVSGPGVTRCNTDTGTVWLGYCAPGDMQDVRVDYTGGYSTIPDDLATAAAALTAALYRRSSRDTSLQSERLGDYSWTAGGNSVESLSPDAARLLARFRRIL